MYINSEVVASLMALKQIDIDSLASLVHVRSEHLESWLDNSSNTDGLITYEVQLEILAILGVRKEAPRGDVVHYWRVDEPLLGSVSRIYQPLQAVLKAFGGAKVSYVAREADPAFASNAFTCFCLQFDNFLALLEVHGHPLRNVRFDPEELGNLAWNTDVQGIILSEEQYDSLEPGALSTEELKQYLNFNTELVLWDKLRKLAADRGIQANQAMALLEMAATSPEAPAVPVLREVKSPIPGPGSISIVPARRAREGLVS
jgi:hypothetical protein